MTLLADIEYRRIRHLAAFNIAGAKGRKVNQHMREYTFEDGSILRIYRDSKATVAQARGDFQTVTIGTIRANAFGA